MPVAGIRSKFHLLVAHTAPIPLMTIFPEPCYELASLRDWRDVIPFVGIVAVEAL